MTDLEKGVEAQPVPQPPVLRVISSNATAEEVAALITVFATMSQGEPAEKPRTSAWVQTARTGRHAPRPAPMAWRLSTRG